MKRNYLSGLGLESDIIDKILDANNADIEREKEKAAAAEAKIGEEIQGWKTKASSVEAELSHAKKEFEEYKASSDNGEDWKAKYEAEVTAHKATQDGYAAEKDAADIDSKVSEALKTAGFNEKFLGDLMNDKRFDRTMAKRGKDGAISNADEIVAAVKSIGNWGALFGTIESLGADVGTPPAGKPAAKDHKSLLEDARKAGDTQAAVRIKTEAAKDGVFLI